MKSKSNLCLIMLTTLALGCASFEDNGNNSVTEKSLSGIKPGASCGIGCVWSLFAVEYGIQQGQTYCVGGECACVKEGDAHSLCQSQEQNQVVESFERNSTSDIPSIGFFSQYDNAYAGPYTCQNTSIAMVINYYEVNKITPDDIFVKWGKDYAQSPSGLNRVYNFYSQRSTITTNTSASPEYLKNELSKGNIAIVHGYFTSAGHVLVVRGFDGTHYYVNDPAGEWEGCFKCGYRGSYNGVTKYDKQSFENAVFTSNGYSYLPGWIHIIKN